MKSHNVGRITPIVKTISRIIGRDQSLLLDDDRLMANVFNNIPQLKDKTKCPNCDASMAQYEYNLDVLDVALLIGMGRSVKENMKAGIEFTQANKVHVPTLEVSDAIRHRTTKCSKLGLVAKKMSGDSQEKGMWVITNRGFSALRGEEIVTGRIVWRGGIIDRPDTLTTFGAVRMRYTERMETYEYKHHKHHKDDHREEMGDYKASDWVEFAGHNTGNLF